MKKGGGIKGEEAGSFTERWKALGHIEGIDIKV